MAPRLELQALLEALLGSRNVYFQPPANFQMHYPCFVYERDDIDIAHADNGPYKHKTRYKVTLIHADVDNDIHTKVGMLPTAAFDRSFSANNLNHDVYTIFF